jgi:hypothetical protein
VRSLVAVVVNLAMGFAFVQAPFQHTHQHEATRQHPGSFFHTHLAIPPVRASVPEFRGLDPNEDAQFQNWFSATSVPSGVAPVALPTAIRMPEFQAADSATEEPKPRAHDPPLVNNRSPRAPPA